MSVSTSEGLKTSSIYKEQNGKKTSCVISLPMKIRASSFKANERFPELYSEVQNFSPVNLTLLYSEYKNVYWVILVMFWYIRGPAKVVASVRSYCMSDGVDSSQLQERLTTVQS